jgi:hypothetical protein
MIGRNVETTHPLHQRSEVLRWLTTGLTQLSSMRAMIAVELMPHGAAWHSMMERRAQETPGQRRRSSTVKCVIYCTCCGRVEGSQH